MIRAGVLFVLATSAACARTVQPPAAPPIASYVFEDRGGLPVMAVRIEHGEPGNFLLDTGASPCVVDSTVAAATGIASVAEERDRQGGAGSFRSRVVPSALELRLGADVLTCHETIVVDLSGLTDVVGTRLDGILGGDFFRGRVVAIDYDRERVEIFRRASYDTADARLVPIRIDRNRPYVIARLSVAGGPQDSTRELLVDTGSRDHVDDTLLLEGSQAVQPATTTGLGRGARTASGTFSKVRIGTHIFHDVPGVVPAVPVVGTGIIARFNPVFDYDGGWMILRERRK